jgi:tubulin-folding cofactor B
MVSFPLDSVREFKRRNQIGRFDPQKASSKENDLISVEEIQQRIAVGQRCQVEDGAGASGKRGLVKFVGLTDFKPGVWIGVEYDEPIGKHNGTVGNKSYFIAKPLHGAMVRPNRVEVGDFPEIDILEEMEEV